MITQIILISLLQFIIIWLATGALCFIGPQVYAHIVNKHKLTSLDIVMFFRFTFKGFFSLYTIIVVIRRIQRKRFIKMPHICKVPVDKDCFNCDNLHNNKECLKNPVLCGSARILWLLNKELLDEENIS